MQEVKREDIRRFAEITDDFSRIHLDREYALSLGLADNFAHGLLGASWAVGVVSRGDEEAAEVPVAAEFNFGVPVFCGDSLNVESGVSRSSRDCEFAIVNQRGQQCTHGSIQFSNSGAFLPTGDVAVLDPDEFSEDKNKVYGARDMYEDGPRGRCAPIQFSSDDVQAYIAFSGENGRVYFDADGDKYISVPSMLVFCRAFSSWLKAFTSVQTPDGGFPGHIQDSWRQHASVQVGDNLTPCHQVTGFRQSNSRPDMALITIELQVANQSLELVQSGSVLLMMPA
jgi:acyl dehydratase